MGSKQAKANHLDYYVSQLVNDPKLVNFNHFFEYVIRKKTIIVRPKKGYEYLFNVSPYYIQINRKRNHINNYGEDGMFKFYYYKSKNYFGLYADKVISLKHNISGLVRYFKNITEKRELKEINAEGKVPPAYNNHYQKTDIS